MALILKDRVKETATVEGTGSVTLAGSVEGFQSFASVLGSSDTTYYAISHRNADEWEVGLGTYSTGTLDRTTVLESSNSGAAVSFTAGTKDVFITLPAEKAVVLDANYDLSVGNIITTGYLRGPAVFTIDPAAHGDDTGTLVIAGNLQVDGVTTTINSTTLNVDDLNLTLASGAATPAAANGAGITVDGAAATITYDSASDRWVMNKALSADVVGNVTGQVSSISNHSTTDVVEGTNLYYTATRFDDALATKTTADLTEGVNLYYTAGRFDTAFSAKNTTDLTEGTNLYYTTGRFDSAFDTRIATKSTTDLAEGTNLYYTASRVDAHVTKAFVDSLNVDADTLDGLNSTDYATATQGNNADTAFSWGNHASEGYLTSVPQATLDGLVDVDTSTVAPTNGQTLVWNSTTSQWEPGASAGGGNTLGGYEVNLTGITTGSILKFDGVKFVVATDNSGATAEVDGGGSASVYNFTINGGAAGSVYTPTDAIDGGDSNV